MHFNPIPNLIKATWIKDNIEIFYIQDIQPAPEGEYARLVLYLPKIKKPKENKPVFTNERTWHYLFHQTAGYACNHVYMTASFLKPSNKMEELMRTVRLDYYESCLYPPVNLKEANKYENLLNKHNLSANDSYHYLQEGLYPIDIKHIKETTSETLPENLNDLMIDYSEYQKFKMLNNENWQLAILTNNCD